MDSETRSGVIGVTTRIMRSGHLCIKPLVMAYYVSTILHQSFPEAVEATIGALKEKGFGIITRIDLQETFHQKIGKDIRPYLILGACNPNYAYEALQKENKVGTMLPCNVIVQELADGSVEVAAIDPVASMAAIDNPELLELAGQVAEHLVSTIAGLGSDQAP